MNVSVLKWQWVFKFPCILFSCFHVYNWLLLLGFNLQLHLWHSPMRHHIYGWPVPLFVATLLYFCPVGFLGNHYPFRYESEAMNGIHCTAQKQLTRIENQGNRIHNFVYCMCYYLKETKNDYLFSFFCYLKHLHFLFICFGHSLHSGELKWHSGQRQNCFSNLVIVLLHEVSTNWWHLYHRFIACVLAKTHGCKEILEK